MDAAVVVYMLLGDHAYRLAPLTLEDAAGLVRSVRAAPLLFGEYGYPPVAVDLLEDLLVRMGQLADALPEVTRMDLDQVLVGAVRGGRPRGASHAAARGGTTT